MSRAEARIKGESYSADGNDIPKPRQATPKVQPIPKHLKVLHPVISPEGGAISGRILAKKTVRTAVTGAAKKTSRVAK